MVSVKITLFALFCFSCLSYSESVGTMVPEHFKIWSPVTNFSSYVLPWDIIPQEPTKVTKCVCLPPTLLVDRTYTDLGLAILQKVSQDARTYSATAGETFVNYLESSLTQSRQFGFLVLERFLWGLAKLWSSLILVSAYSIWFLVVNFTVPVLVLALCYILTMFMVRIMRFLFGGLPVLMITGTWSLLRNCFLTLSSKPRCIYEKAIDGFKSFKIPQSPPKSCVLPISYASGCHAGYASCVKLYNGENALLTATHIVDIKDPLYVNSVKGVSSKIPLSNFKVIRGSVKGDVTLLRGPPNWEGALGCKASTMVTAQQLSKCDATIYVLEKSGWMASHAKLVGSDGLNVQVLSNTDGGHSGSPYFNGKFILGVHSGASIENNYNLMAPIPHLPGLTCSQYVFETTAPQGRIFSEPDLETLAREYEEGEKIMKFKSTSGKNWADYGDEDDQEFYDSKPVYYEASSNFPLNEERGTDRVTNGAGSSIPKNDNVDGNEMMEKIISSLVGKINLESIEKRVVDQISTKAMKKTTRPRRRRSKTTKQQPENLKPTSNPSTNGRYQPPHVRSPGSVTAASCPATTTPSKKKNHAGAKPSSGTIPRWVRKPAASAGPNSGPKPNSQA